MLAQGMWSMSLSGLRANRRSLRGREHDSAINGWLGKKATWSFAPFPTQLLPSLSSSIGCSLGNRTAAQKRIAKTGQIYSLILSFDGIFSSNRRLDIYERA